jgi:hypothetical protein
VEGHPGERASAALHPSGKLMVLGSDAKNVLLREFETNDAKSSFEASDPDIYFLNLSPDGRWVVAGSYYLHLWHATSGKPPEWLRDRKPFTEATGPYAAAPVIFSPDSQWFATRQGLWNLSTGRRRRLVDYDRGWGDGCAVAFSPDGSTLAIGRNAVVLWEKTTGKVRAEIPQEASCLTFSPDGRTLAVAGRDRVVRLWDILSGKALGSFEGHEGWITSIAFSANGGRLFTGSADTTILVWDISGLTTNRQGLPVTLTNKELQDLWAALAGEDAAKAYQAGRRLAADPERSVLYFQERLKPTAPVTASRIDQLVAELDSSRFAVREKATHELADLGELAEPALRKALAHKPSLEVTRRLEQLLQRVEPISKTDTVRNLRAIEVLEQIGTSSVRALESLAKGSPEALVTREANGALDRLRKRSTYAR